MPEVAPRRPMPVAAVAAARPPIEGARGQRGQPKKGAGGQASNQVAPTKVDVERVLERVQKKDVQEIFKEPVTDEMVRADIPIADIHCVQSLDSAAIWAFITAFQSTTSPLPRG